MLQVVKQKNILRVVCAYKLDMDFRVKIYSLPRKTTYMQVYKVHCKRDIISEMITASLYLLLSSAPTSAMLLLCLVSPSLLNMFLPASFSLSFPSLSAFSSVFSLPLTFSENRNKINIALKFSTKN